MSIGAWSAAGPMIEVRTAFSRHHVTYAGRAVGKPATISDVAAHAGVSKATVSKALNHPETSEISAATVATVQAAAEALGYRPRTTGTGAALRRIALVSGRAAPITDGAFTGALEALMLAALEHRMQVQLVPALAGLDRLDADLTAGRIDGVVAMDPMPTGLDAFLAARRLPAVLLNQYSEQPLSQVRPDDARLMRTLLDHQLALGHRAVAYVQWDRHDYHPSERVRQAAYTAACVELGLDATVVLAPTQGELAAACADLAAMVAYNTSDAIHLLRGSVAAGRSLPDDLSLCCFDDVDEGRLVDPPLTCVAVPARAMAARAVALLARQFAGEREPVVELVDGGLVVRGSTAPPRNRERNR